MKTINTMVSLLALALAACSAKTDTAANETGVSTPKESESTPARERVAFDAEKIDDLLSGKAITDAFGIACPAAAGTNGRPDMQGVALGAGLKDAVAVLACRYPEAEFHTNAPENNGPYTGLNESVYALDLRFKPQDGRDHESLDVYLSGQRGEEKVVGVWRVIYYKPQNAPLTEKIMEQLVAKYGRFDPPVEISALNTRAAYTRATASNGQPLASGAATYVCLNAINFATVAYNESGAVDRAAQAGCGDTIAHRIGTNVGAGLAGEFVTFLFNPSFGAEQHAQADGQADRDRATGDQQTRDAASGRTGPSL